MIIIKPKITVWHLYTFIPIALFASMGLDHLHLFSHFVVIDCCLLVPGLLIKKTRESKAFYFYIPVISFGLCTFLMIIQH